MPIITESALKSARETLNGAAIKTIESLHINDNKTLSNVTFGDLKEWLIVTNKNFVSQIEEKITAVIQPCRHCRYADIVNVTCDLEKTKSRVEKLDKDMKDYKEAWIKIFKMEPKEMLGDCEADLQVLEPGVDEIDTGCQALIKKNGHTPSELYQLRSMITEIRHNMMELLETQEYMKNQYHYTNKTINGYIPDHMPRNLSYYKDVNQMVDRNEKLITLEEEKLLLSEIRMVEEEEREMLRIAQEKIEKERLELEEMEKIKAEEAELARLEWEEEELAWIEREEAEIAKMEAEEAELQQIEAEERELARMEAEDAELAKLEAEEKELARIEAEKAKTEAEKAEIGKIETQNAAWAKLVAEEAELAKLEEEQAELLRIEEEEKYLARLEAEEKEMARIEAEEKELTQIEAEEAELAKIEAEEAELSKIDAEEAELAKLEVQEVELAPIEAEEVELARLEAKEAVELAKKQEEEDHVRKEREEGKPTPTTKTKRKTLGEQNMNKFQVEGNKIGEFQFR